MCLVPQTKLQSPQIETWNTVNQWSFCQFLECQATLHKRKALRRNANPLLKTLWRRFCLNLGDSDRLNESVCCFDWFMKWFSGLHGNKWNRTLKQNNKMGRTAAKHFLVKFWNFAKTKILASRPQRPVAPQNDVTSKKLLADCFKTFSGLFENLWRTAGRLDC